LRELHDCIGVVHRVPEKEFGGLPAPYWLCHCEQSEVFAPEGRIGTVRGSFAAPAWIGRTRCSSNAGLLRKRTMVASADDVERVDPTQRRLILRRVPTADIGLPEVL
jgi:hypothetical protein